MTRTSLVPIVARVGAGLALAALCTLPAARAARAQDARFGYVNMARAMEEIDEGRKAKAALKKELETKQKEIDEQQQEIRKAMEDLDKKRSLLPPDAIQKKEAEIRGHLEKVQAAYMRHQQDLAGKEQQALGPVIQRIQRVIAKIASAENLTMVFDQQQAGLLWAKPSLDVTNELVRRLNAGEGNEGGGAAGAAAAKKGAAPLAPSAPAKKK